MKANTLLYVFKQYIDKLRRALSGKGRVEDLASQRRSVRAILSTFFMSGEKVLQFFVGIVSVPILISYLGIEGYGLLVTASSTMSWFYMADIGIGSGIKNSLIEAFGKNDRERAQAFVSTGFFGLGVVTLILLIVFLTCWSFIPWQNVFKLSTDRYSADLRLLVLVTSLLIIIKLPMNIVGAVYSSDQKDYVMSSWNMIGNVLSFLALVLAVKLDWSIVWLTLGRGGMFLATTIACGFFLFFIDKKWIRPKLKSFSWSAWKQVLPSSISFFIIQVSLIAIFQSDMFIINYFINASEVPYYSLPASIFMYINTFLYFVVAPLWAGFGEAVQQGHWVWIRNTFRKIVILLLSVSTFMSVILLILGPTIVNIWSKGAVHVSRPIFLILGLYSVLRAWTSIHSMFLNGLNKIHGQALILVCNGLLNIIISIYLVRRIGIIGVALGSLISYIMTTGWYLPLSSYRILKMNGKPSF